MTTNFIRYGGEAGEPPNRVYARIDRIEPEFAEPNEPVTAVFDGVDAHSFESTRGRFQIESANLSVIEVDFFDPTLVAVELKEGGESGEDKQDGDEGSPWFQIDITSTRTPIRLRQYTNLFGAPNRRFLDKIQRINDPVLNRDLNDAVSIDVPTALPETLRNALQRVQSIIGAGVYDVGQRGCQAFLAPDGFPVVYFDFGGGVLANTKTFPEAVKGFCTTQRPLIILSHLDWDHWSSAQRFRNALKMTWVLPRQEMGFTHRAFLADVLGSGGQILFWPSGLDSMSVGQIKIDRCIGNGRNHSGLAAVLQSPDQREKMLFTGDARYSVIPSARADQFLAVVAPHHGGDVRNNYVPRKDPGKPDRAVFSYGDGNSYKHPAPISFTRHTGWTDLETADRQPNPALGADAPGHVGLFWTGIQPVLHQPCRGTQCTMEIAQI
jgi:hypothetical protein